MKPTLLLATLSMVLASPVAFAKSELETLRSRCSEQERQIRQLEDENSKLRSGSHEAHTAPTKTESISQAPAKPVKDEKPYVTAATTSTYVIKAGDTIEKIARQVGTKPETLAKSNGITVSSIIHPGQKLKVPNATSTKSPMVSTVASKKPEKSAKSEASESVSTISKNNPLGSSTTMITATASRPKASVTAEKAPAPVAKSTETRQSTPASAISSSSLENEVSSKAATQPVTENDTPSPKPEMKTRSVTIDGEMTYGDFAIKHGTDAERLNALNGLDLTKATVLAKGSELYVPAQP